ncbi:hypothetical protein [Rhizobium ruizarguesonis]|uniref:hypothetical protein n=1 Tax=Rhizobium ruizarguesonis TaxID=2081791 RepID=UPI00103159CB|nr:hypothetical protein [Rhizobium ruizarguesonis]TAZ76555.1 hypothetical protein ELH68_01630 [Rhizobium ruizarguesonis]TBA03188.1 hypothetical protein ELH64_01615 [Rhizobium ruizarguesonis]
MPQLAAQIWADGPVDSPQQPDKAAIRVWGTFIESFISAIGANSGSVYTTRSLLLANLAPAANSMAWVMQDTTTAYNGIYQKVGSTNSGTWVRVGDLPFSFIVASDNGSGTPDNILATTSVPVSGSALIWFAISEPNAGSPVTVSFNGDSPLTIKTNSGQDPAPGGLVGILLGVKIGSVFRLVSDQSGAAIQAAAEAAAVTAAGYAALARNDVVVNSFTGNGSATDFTLTVDPGSANNMRVNMGGAAQFHASYSLVYVSTVPKIRFSEAPPDGVAFEVEMGFRIAVGTPATGSVTYDKIQNVAATLRLLGRKTAGAGVVEEVAPNEMRPFLPDGSVIQSARAVYTANAAISATIPMDNTIPQITEGAEILTLAITPTSTTNKFRIRWSGQAASTIANAQMIWGIFKGGQANALSAGFVNSDVVNAGYQMDGGAEYVPGVLTSQTISVRVGTNTSGGASMRLNGTTAAAFLGGASAAELIVEEIKA